MLDRLRAVKCASVVEGSVSMRAVDAAGRLNSAEAKEGSRALIQLYCRCILLRRRKLYSLGYCPIDGTGSQNKRTDPVNAFASAWTHASRQRFLHHQQRRTPQQSHTCSRVCMHARIIQYVYIVYLPSLNTGIYSLPCREHAMCKREHATCARGRHSSAGLVCVDKRLSSDVIAPNRIDHNFDQ
jgi:hypothetical protein